MQNAYECEEEFGRGGRCLKRVRRVGNIVPWAMVAGFAIYHGRELPPVFWGLFQAAGK